MLESKTRLIIGLGNPDRKYEHTRHNLGFLVVRHLAKNHRLEFTRNAALKGFIARGKIGSQKTILFLPLTYMNNSGVAVREVVGKKKIALENALVVCDDLNIDFGQLRLRADGSDGGHNGLSSLIAHLKTNKFARLRCGIGRPLNKEDTVDFVLSEFEAGEKKELNDLVKEAADCCVVWLTEGTNKAMDQFNQKEGK